VFGSLQGKNIRADSVRFGTIALELYGYDGQAE
jgi:hypothetical protein